MSQAARGAASGGGEGDTMADMIRLAGLNGIQVNLHVAFHNAVEEIIDRVMASPELEGVSSEALANLIEHAILTYELPKQNVKITIEDRRERKD